MTQEVTPKHSDHLSNSQVNEFLMCGQLYKYHRIDGRIPMSGLGATAGKAFHQYMASAFRDLGEPQKVLEERAEICYWAEWSGKDMDSFLPPPKNQKELDGSKKNLLTCARETFAKYREELKPMAIEQEFNIELNGTKIKGFIDMITEDGILIDWKTGKNKPGEGAANMSAQLAIYDMAYRKLTGNIPEKIGLIWAGWRVKDGVIFDESWSPPCDDERMERVTTRFGLLSQALKNNGPWLPASDGHWKCTKKFCGFYDECKVRA